MKSGLGIIGLIVVLFVALTGVGMGIRYFMASPQGALDAEVTVQSGGNRLSAYNHFFDLCASIQASEAGLDAQFDALEQATSENQRDRINTNISALKTNRLRSIQQYNADARKYTVGQFRDSDLPHAIPETVYDQENRNKTSCHA